MKTFGVILTLIALAVGCVSHSAAPPAQPKAAASGSTLLFIRDGTGAIVAKGQLLLPSTLPSEGKAFDGHWTLESSTKEFPTDAVSSGWYTGEIYQGQAEIDLNPGTADNNVMLTGKQVNGILSGRCWIAKFAGGKTLGSFTVGEADGHVH